MRKSVSVLLFFVLAGSILYAQVPSGYAVKFDGVNTYINCGNSESLQITGTQITLEAWIYNFNWRTNVWEGDIINKEQASPDAGYMMRCGNEGELNFNLGDGKWNEAYSMSGWMAVENWYHVAATYDGVAQRLYIDGGLVIEQDTSIVFNNSGQDVILGSCQIYPSRTLDGMIDEVRIWNVARTEEQIVATMADTLGPEYYATADSGLVGYWRFDEGAGQIAHDMTHNGNDGMFGSSEEAEVDLDPAWVESPSGYVVSVKNFKSNPETHALAQNYPNPFNPSTTIAYSLPNAGNVTLQVFDVLGKEIQTLVNEFQPANNYSVRFDAGSLPSGVYYYQLQVDDKLVQTNKMLLMR